MPTISEQVILADGKGAFLTRTRFIYKNKTYPLQYIARAEVQETFFGLPKLIITMKSGNNYTFKVGKVSNRAMARDVLFDANFNSMRGEARANATQWATTISILLVTSANKIRI